MRTLIHILIGLGLFAAAIYLGGIISMYAFGMGMDPWLTGAVIGGATVAATSFTNLLMA